MQKDALFPGRGEIDQIGRVSKRQGTYFDRHRY
jgi:hypothetical protein